MDVLILTSPCLSPSTASAQDTGDDRFALKNCSASWGKDLHCFCCKVSNSSTGLQRTLGIMWVWLPPAQSSPHNKKVWLTRSFLGIFLHLCSQQNTEGSNSPWNTGASFLHPPGVICVECRGQNGNAFRMWIGLWDDDWIFYYIPTCPAL